jgi:NAD(P)-dependent dehydrogenase (short-subunit alcohol dehydrogenase family)
MERAMLTGKVAWITGATGGVGPSVVKTLADAGATVLASARDAAAVAALAAEHGISAERWLALPVDLTDEAAVQAAVAAGVARFGGIDILVAVAGAWRGGATVAETEAPTLDFLWRVNVQTAFNACRAVLPHMTEQDWGRIITFGARAAATGQAKSGAYAASKAAVLALTQSIAVEVRASGVTANTLLLSTVDTPDNRAAMPAADWSKWVQPAEIAEAVRFLCSDAAAALSGAAIPLYGRA